MGIHGINVDPRFPGEGATGTLQMSVFQVFDSSSKHRQRDPTCAKAPATARRHRSESYLTMEDCHL